MDTQVATKTGAEKTLSMSGAPGKAREDTAINIDTVKPKQKGGLKAKGEHQAQSLQDAVQKPTASAAKKSKGLARALIPRMVLHADLVPQFSNRKCRARKRQKPRRFHRQMRSSQTQRLPSACLP